MNKQKGISQIVVMIVMLVLAIALPVTTSLVKKSQENRSKAATENCTSYTTEPSCSGDISCSWFTEPGNSNDENGHCVARTTCDATDEVRCKAVSKCDWYVAASPQDNHCFEKTTTTITQDAKCTNVGGRCQNTSESCNTGYLTGYCPSSGTDIKCCVTTHTGPAYTNDSRCSSIGGFCGDFLLTPAAGSSCTVTEKVTNGLIWDNLCGGDTTVKCCTPSTGSTDSICGSKSNAADCLEGSSGTMCGWFEAASPQDSHCYERPVCTDNDFDIGSCVSGGTRTVTKKMSSVCNTSLYTPSTHCDYIAPTKWKVTSGSCNTTTGNYTCTSGTDSTFTFGTQADCVASSGCDVAVTPTGITCGDNELSGSNHADEIDKDFEMGRNSGHFTFTWRLYAVPDRVQVFYENTLLFDKTDGNNDYQSVVLSYGPGTSTKIHVHVIPDVNAPAWYYKVACAVPGITPTVVPTIIPTITPTTAVISPSISFKISFAGLKPNALCESNLLGGLKSVLTKRSIGTSIAQNIISPVGTGRTISNGDEIYSVSSLLFSSFDTSSTDNVLRIKGGKHGQMRYCLNNQTGKLISDSPCNISLGTDLVYNFSNYSILPGDLDQNGAINGVDFSILKRNLDINVSEIGVAANCSRENVKTADLNGDGLVNGIDVQLFKNSLGYRDDE